MNGILNINKETDMTSFDVVAIVRRGLHIKKVGHTGTLDPDATGVLPICIGRATRVCDLLLDADKSYRAEVILGACTDTDDKSGQILTSSSHKVQEDEVLAVLDQFKGKIEQIPPMYSAVKVSGRKLYELARKGIEIERKKRAVTVYAIRLISFDYKNQCFTIEVDCSKGTYIRALCRDIGESLKTYAHMGELVRTKSGIFGLENALSIKEFRQACEKNEIEKYLMPIDTVFQNLTPIVVDDEQKRRIYNGNELLAYKVDPSIKTGEKYRLYSNKNEFLAIYQCFYNEEYNVLVLKCIKSFFEV